MRVAIFSDVHGNIYSFDNIFNSMQKDKIDKYIYCGDLCGYYYYQNEIIELFQEMNNLICITGNHDKHFINLFDNKDLIQKHDIEKYGNSDYILLESITDKNIEYLKNLNIKYDGIIDNSRVGVFHGSPFNYLEEYIYPTTPMNRFKELNYNIVFLGHTHYSMYKKLNNMIIVNPGSCGQPRNGELPSYVIWDTSTNDIEFKYVEYDYIKLINDVKKYDKDNEYLINILYRGRK